MDSIFEAQHDCHVAQAFLNGLGQLRKGNIIKIGYACPERARKNMQWMRISTVDRFAPKAGE